MSPTRAFIEQRDGVRFCDPDPLDPWAETDVICAHCGASAEWIDCENCTDGFTGHDCGEDTCCCVDPQDNVECDQCDGVEGYWRCTASVHHGGEA